MATWQSLDSFYSGYSYKLNGYSAIKQLLLQASMLLENSLLPDIWEENVSLNSMHVIWTFSNETLFLNNWMKEWAEKYGKI